jgi:hypothetical protein
VAKKAHFVLIGIIAAVAIGLSFAYSFGQFPFNAANSGASDIIHEHAILAVFIDGVGIDFSQMQYQLRHVKVHFEDGDGDIIHMHTKGVTLGFLFETLLMQFNGECLTTDYGTQHCNDGEKTLKFFVNGEKNEMYDSYVPNDGDRILISYGTDDQEEINEQLDVAEKLGQIKLGPWLTHMKP